MNTLYAATLVIYLLAALQFAWFNWNRRRERSQGADSNAQLYRDSHIAFYGAMTLFVVVAVARLFT